MNAKATVFDIQRFSLHDGPGIRTIIFIKGCLLRCKWCANPESNNLQRELFYYPSKCIGCGMCLKVCDKGAIGKDGDMITYDRSKCDECLDCAKVCHTGARKISGTLMTAQEAFAEVKKDSVFYYSSGGGVTFSGGEPLLQVSFVKEVAKLAKEEGYNTAVETCGLFPKENLQKLMDCLDLFLFDIKFISEDKHITYCGKSNKLILENFENIVGKKSIIIRIPIIPNINDSIKELTAIKTYLQKYKNAITEIHLLPYHSLGANKYKALGRKYRFDKIKAPSKERMREIQDLLKETGILVKIGG